MKPREFKFEIRQAPEPAAGIIGFTDTITVIVASGDPGGEEGEFKEHLREILHEWYDGADVYLVSSKHTYPLDSNCPYQRMPDNSIWKNGKRVHGGHCLVEGGPGIPNCSRDDCENHISFKIVNKCDEMKKKLARCTARLKDHTPKHKLNYEINIGDKNTNKEYFRKAIENIIEVLDIVSDEGIEVLFIINYYYMNTVVSVLNLPDGDEPLKNLYDIFNESLSCAMCYNDLILGCVTRDIMLNEPNFINEVGKHYRIEINDDH